MNICIAFNDGYLLPIRVMLSSLINNNSSSELHIYVLYSSLSDETINTINDLADDKVRFFFKKVDDSFLDGITILERFSREIYYRLLAHRLLDDSIDKALWLDGDMIINGSLEEFYAQGFDDKLFIAVEDMTWGGDEGIHKKLNMPMNYRYINSGVMLFNLEQMRKELKDDEIIQYLIENQAILELPDQDVFNGLLYKRFKVVDPQHLFNFAVKYLTLKNRKSIYKEGKIIHYCGECKPWKKNYKYLAYDLWWENAFKTDPKTIELYKEINLSCRIAQMKNLPIRFMKGYFPKFYNALLNYFLKVKGVVKRDI